MHCLYFIWERKFYARAHVKISRHWKSTLMESFLEVRCNSLLFTEIHDLLGKCMIGRRVQTSQYHELSGCYREGVLDPRRRTRSPAKTRVKLFPNFTSIPFDYLLISCRVRPVKHYVRKQLPQTILEEHFSIPKNTAASKIGNGVISLL